MKKLIFTVVTIFLFSAVCYGQEGPQTSRAELMDAKGGKAGMAALSETPKGVLITVELWDLPPGPHAFHIHSAGRCEPPFTTAGGHYNPHDKKHGVMNPGGMHAGDLPNIHIGQDGKGKVEVLASQVTLGKGTGSLFDEDGSALVIHAGADDYKSDPAGEAGPRIACGVIVR